MKFPKDLPRRFPIDAPWAAFVVFSLVAGVLAWLFFWAGERRADTTPSVDLVVRLDVPSEAGSVEIYLNRDYWNPSHHDLTRSGEQEFRVRNVPTRTTQIRVNPTDRSGLTVRILEISARTAIGYTPAPDRVLHDFLAEGLDGWGLMGLERTQDGTGLVTTSDDPTLIRDFDLDVAGRIPRAGAATAAYGVVRAVAAVAGLLTGGLALWTLALTFRSLFAQDWRLAPRRFGDWRLFPHATVGLAVATVAWTAAGLYGLSSSCRYGLCVDLQFEMIASPQAGKAQVYVNADWHAPYATNVDASGRTRRLFHGLPRRIRHLRIDPGFREGAVVEDILLVFQTSSDFVPAPGRELVRFALADMLRAAQLSGVERRTDGPGIVLTSKTPTISMGMDLDLPPLLPPGTPTGWPAKVVALWTAWAFAGALGIAAWTITAIAARRRWPRAGTVMAVTTVAALGWTATILSGFPGHWSYDQYYSLNVYLAGRLDDLQPILFALDWAWLMRIAAALGFGSLGQIASLLFVQATIFWMAMAILCFAFASRPLALGMLALVAALPSTLAYIPEIGKDGQVLAGFVAATALIFLAERFRSFLALVAAVPALFLAWAIRSNAPPAVVPMIVLWAMTAVDLWRRRTAAAPLVGPAAPASSAPRRWRAFTPAAALSVLLATTIHLANEALFDAFVVQRCCRGTPGYATLTHDMMGISYFTGINVVPDYLLRRPDVSVADIARRYFPPENVDLTDVRGIYDEEDRRRIPRDWLRAIVDHPGAYIRHRLEVLKYFLGLQNGPVTYALFTGVHWAEYPWVAAAAREVFHGLNDIPAAMTAAKRTFSNYFMAFRDTWVFRPWFYLIVFANAFLFLRPAPANATSRLSLFLGLSAALYFLPLIPLTSSASFRYVSWPVLATLMIVFMRLDGLHARGASRRDVPMGPEDRGAPSAGLSLRPPTASARIRPERATWLHSASTRFVGATVLLALLVNAATRWLF